MPTSHRDLDFSIVQNIALHLVGIFGISKKQARTASFCRFMFEYSLLQPSRRNRNRFVLSEKARMYFRHKRRNSARFWLPVIISILALLSGYDVYANPTIEKLLQTVMQLLKTITENLGTFFGMGF